MNFLLQPILTFLLLYKYAALLGVTFLAALILPLPSAPALMAAAAFASQGFLNIALVFLVAILGNLAGDNVGYFLARAYGRPVLNKIGFKKILGSPTFAWVESKVGHYRGLFIFFSRFNVLTTISLNLMAGLSKMPYRDFLLFDVLGETTQVLIFGGLGYVFGSNWQKINEIFGRFTLAVVLVLALILVLMSKEIQKQILKMNSRDEER